MQKILKLLIPAVLTVLLNSGIASAELAKNFYGYQVKNVNIRQLVFEIDNAIAAYQGNDKFKPLEDVSNAYIYSDENCSYFVKLYPSNQNNMMLKTMN